MALPANTTVQRLLVVEDLEDARDMLQKLLALSLKIEVDAAESGSSLDGILQILDAKGGVLATADDTTVPVAGKNGNAKPPGIVSPDPPNSLGKSFSLGRPSCIGRTVSA